MQLLHLFVIFHNFSNFANFHVFCNFSTESACPTRSHQLLFSRRGDPSFWQTVGGQSNLYQTWYDVHRICCVTTRHGFSLNSGFTKIWWQPDLPLYPYLKNYKFGMLQHSNTTVLNDSITVCMTVQLTNRSVPHIEDLEVQEEEENCEQLLLTYLLLCTAILCD